MPFSTLYQFNEVSCFWFLETDYPDWYSEILKYLGIDDSDEILPEELQICGVSIL